MPRLNKLHAPRSSAGVNRAARIALTGAVGTAALLASGCIVSVGGSRGSTAYAREIDATSYRVDQFEFDRILATTRSLEAGMDRDDVLTRYEPRLLAKFSTLRIDTGDERHVIEEWRMRATRPSMSHERWFYFVNGELDGFHDSRLDDDEVRYLATVWTDDDSESHKDSDIQQHND